MNTMPEKYISPEEQDRREKRLIEVILLREVNFGQRYFPSSLISALTGLPVRAVIKQMFQLKNTSLLFDISTNEVTLSPIWDIRKKKKDMLIKTASESAHLNHSPLEKTEALCSDENCISDTYQKEMYR